jgi:hypothetical protein
MSTADQALNECAQKNMSQSKWIPMGMYGSEESNAIDSYISDVAHAIATAQQTCAYGSTGCKNEWISDGCTIDAGTVTQTCILDLNTVCISNGDYIVQQQLGAQIAAITDSYIANTEALAQSEWAQALYNLQYVMVSTITQTCAAQVLAQNTFACTDSTLSFTAIDMCNYMDAQINCILAAPSFPTAYQAAYQALKGSIPVPRGATFTGPAKIEAIVMITVVAVLLLVAVIVSLHFGSVCAVTTAGPWLLGVGLALAVAFVPGFALLYWPFQDPFENGTKAAWTVPLADMVEAGQFNTAMLGLIVGLSTVCIGVGSGLLIGEDSYSRQTKRTNSTQFEEPKNG